MGGRTPIIVEKPLWRRFYSSHTQGPFGRRGAQYRDGKGKECKWGLGEQARVVGEALSEGTGFGLLDAVMGGVSHARSAHHNLGEGRGVEGDFEVMMSEGYEQ